jgi:SRSO17 transposase
MTFTLDFPSAIPSKVHSPASAELSPALVRFVTDGLTATLESYRAGQLPLHRFVWELTTRIDTLDELAGAHARRAVTRLRWIARSLATLHTELAAGRAELTLDEENSLTVTLVSLRTALAQLDPHNPIDPTGAARPATVTTPAVRALRCVA